jgi:hypothetical protein
MKIVVLIGGGRTGIDFFQSLLDGHPQIIQFPGVFYFDEFLKRIKKLNDAKKICQIFLDYNKNFFDSRKNKRERHHKLGKNRNQFFKVSKLKFEKSFIKIISKKNINNKKDLLISLHQAYHFAIKKKFNQKNSLIVLHLHHVYRLTCMKGLKYSIVYTVRHPFASITSLLNHWFKVDQIKRTAPEWFYFQLDRIFYGIKKSQTFAPTSVIKLENLHINNIKIMKKFCKKFNINFNNCLGRSTYHNLIWWGDKVSIKYLNGVNKNFKNKIDYSLFFKNDLLFLSKKLKKLMINFNYDLIVDNSSRGYHFLPMKVELIILKNILLKLEIKSLFKFIFYYFKRIALLNDNTYDKVNFKKELI